MHVRYEGSSTRPRHVARVCVRLFSDEMCSMTIFGTTAHCTLARIAKRFLPFKIWLVVRVREKR